MTETLPLFDAFESGHKIVDLAAYRTAHPREPGAIGSLPPTGTRPVSARAKAHRQLMLRHLAMQTRQAVGGCRD